MKPEIIHQRQPTHNSCVCTCIAMALNIPVEDVIAKWHDRYWTEEISLADILADYGVTNIYQPISDVRNPVDRDGIWLIGAPSLNCKGQMHQLLAVAFTEEGVCKWEIYDPQYGNKDAEYYVATTESLDDPKAFKLSCYIADLCILPAA